jgi:hypothetical protein
MLGKVNRVIRDRAIFGLPRAREQIQKAHFCGMGHRLHSGVRLEPRSVKRHPLLPAGGHGTYTFSARGLKDSSMTRRISATGISKRLPILNEAILPL